jgi:hypothetical protein
MNQFGQVGPQGGGDVIPEQSEVDVGFDEVELVADVVATAIKAKSMEGLFIHEGGQGVGE